MYGGGGGGNATASSSSDEFAEAAPVVVFVVACVAALLTLAAILFCGLHRTSCARLTCAWIALSCCPSQRRTPGAERLHADLKEVEFVTIPR